MNVYYGDVKVVLNIKDNISAFEIRYKGKFNAESNMPEEWIIMNNKSKIIGVNLGGETPDVLFNYEGELRIISFKVTYSDLTQKSIPVKNNNLGFWSAIRTKWSDLNSFPEDIKNKYTLGEKPALSSIKQVSLKAKSNNWFFEDGTEYTGDYHKHGDGQAMTGAFHTLNSENIYKKDNNGKIFKLNTNKKTKAVISPISNLSVSENAGGYK